MFFEINQAEGKYAIFFNLELTDFSNFSLTDWLKLNLIFAYNYNEITFNLLKSTFAKNKSISKWAWMLLDAELQTYVNYSLCYACFRYSIFFCLKNANKFTIIF